ncbi:MAG: choice-of-anchor Q domain-containing protein [Phycisphaerales bacterium]
MIRSMTVLALACIAGSTLSQQTIHVPGDIPTLTLALNPTASGLQPGDTIELAQGDYAGSFEVNTPGITIRAAVPREATVDAFNIDSVFTVDAPGAPITFEGLVIRRGSNTGSNGGGINVINAGGIVIRNCEFELNNANAGGAIYSIVPNLTIEDSDFTDNTASLFGGAVRSAGAAGISVTITGSAFTNNRALAGNGGAIDHAGNGAALTIADSTFTGNTCTSAGGAVFAVNANAVTVTGTMFADNIALGTASQDTGGLFVGNSPSVLVRACEFLRNLCAGSGGAVRFADSTGLIIDTRFVENQASAGGAIQIVGNGAAEVYHCAFIDNSALREGNENGRGGAILVNSTTTNEASLTVYNSLFDGNTGTGGGAIDIATESNVDVISSTFVNNTVSEFGSALWKTSGSADARVYNSVFSRNMPANDQIRFNSSSGVQVASFNLVDGGFTAPGTNNVQGSPMFVDPSNGDYSLLPGSPAIDAGSSVLYIGGPLSDLAGNDRGQDDPNTADTGEAIIGAVIDMGAFEFTPPSIADCPADQNFNGVLDPGDFTAWVGNYNAGCP